MAKVNSPRPVPPAAPEAAKPFFDELAALLAARWLAEKATEAKPKSGDRS